jgi:hypothetical protein
MTEDDMTIGRRVRPDGQELTLYRMMWGNTRLCLGWPGMMTFDKAWCYHDTAAALVALQAWNGADAPAGHYKEAGA